MTLINILFGKAPIKPNAKLCISSSTTKKNIQIWQHSLGPVCGIQIHFINTPVNIQTATKLALLTYQTLLPQQT